MSSSTIEKVEQQTRLVGHNRVAMLLFKLGDDQLFGINVFKVREVMRVPALERMPGAKEILAGSCDYRGQTVPVVDLGLAMGYRALREHEAAHMMVTEFSRSVQGFVIGALTRIVHLDGAALSPPSAALGFGNLVNAVTRLDGALIAVVDVEQVLASLEEPSSELSESMMRQVLEQGQQRRRVMVVDDSMVARKQVVNLMHKLNMECVVAQDGREALENLMNADVSAGEEPISLVVSDIEMPLMDGYALTRAIRETPHLRHLKVVLHSSISGIFNEALVREVHADRFVAKFQPDILAAAVMDLLPLPNAQAHMAS